MNLEFHVDPPMAGEWLWHVQGPVLKVCRITGTDPLTCDTADARATVGAPFLAGVVDAQLTGTSPSRIEQPAGEDQLSLAFENGAVVATVGDEPVGAVNGELLRVVSAFMAYWVDHDGLQVSRSLPIEYPGRVIDDDRRAWSLAFSF